MPSSCVMNFVDPDQFQKAVQKPAEVHLVVTGRGRFDASLRHIKLDDGLWMHQSQFSLPAVMHSKMAANRRGFFLQLDADQAPILHSGTEVAPNEIVCYPVESEHHYRATASYCCGGMSLTPEDFEAYEEALTGRPQPTPSAMSVVRPQPHLIAHLLKLHKAITDLVAIAPEVVLHPAVGKVIEQELARALIACLADPDTEEVQRPNRRRLSVMARFEEMLRAQSDEPLYVTDVCAGIGVSERTLRQYCQDQLRMSPQQYLWLRRMHLAQRALAHAEPTAKTVTEIANDHGFAELGRFAVNYRKLFGELPSLTLRRPPG